MAAYRCPECHEPAQKRPPKDWKVPGVPRPSWSHADGEPLCPVMTSKGYRPAPSGERAQ
jgi:hypothetical protein